MKGILTGTAAYGPFTNESDIDIAVPYWEVEGITKALKTLGIKVHDYKHVSPIYQGIWFEFSGKTIQIIAVITDVEMGAWEYATNEMKKLNVYKDREKRIRIFQRFYQIYCEENGIQDYTHCSPGPSELYVEDENDIPF